MQDDTKADQDPESNLHCNDFNKIDFDDKYVKYVSGNDQAEPMFLELIVNGIKLKMELDTGTYVTVISEKYFNKHLKGYTLAKTERNFKVYGNSILQPIGKLTKLTVEFENEKKELECFILPGAGPSLIGRQWLNAFGLWPIKLIHKNKNRFDKIDVENVTNHLYKQYNELFSDTPGMYNKSKTKIHLKSDARLVAMKCRHVAHALRPLIEKELDRLVELGHLEPVEISEWTTPIVPVFKSNGNIRICGDFKLTLNPFIIIDKYPLCTIDEVFASLQGGTIFSELNLTHAYMQFPVDDECTNLLTIVTHKVLFKYKRIPEGVLPAAADVQRKMDECLRGINGAIAYLDNIYVTGRDEIEHKANLEKVCARLQECGLRINKEKSKFMQSKIEVLVFVIDKDGLYKAKSKVLAMINAPQPKNHKELASFLGLVTFYSRFLENRAARLTLLYELLDKKVFEWNIECTEALEWVKDE